MIDWNRVSELRAEVGEEGFAEVVVLFLNEVEETIARLKDVTDHATYEEELHFLKGSALNLGFKALCDICESGESAAANGRAEEVDLATVFAAYDTSKAEFLTRFDAVA